MDPILTVLNDIPRVVAVKGYIDDTTLAGDGTDLNWCTQAWTILMALKTAGIVIEHHSCWKAAEVRMHPVSLSTTLSSTLRDALEQIPACHTAIEAIIQVCSFRSFQHPILISPGRQLHCIIPSASARNTTGPV